MLAADLLPDCAVESGACHAASAAAWPVPHSRTAADRQSTFFQVKVFLNRASMVNTS
ncbi:hypothetical protein D3C73_1373310 [compost metagenome]